MLSAFFLRRGYPEPKPSFCTIEVTSKGSSSRCYMTINGTKTYAVGTYTANYGDVIAFSVDGQTDSTEKTIKLGGKTLHSSTGMSTSTYNYTINGNIEVAFSYDSSQVLIVITEV